MFKINAPVISAPAPMVMATGRQTLPAPLTLVRYARGARDAGDSHLPFAATCSGALHLPDYSSAEAARVKILQALDAGFEMADA